MQQACLFLRQSGFRFATTKFLRDQLASLFVEDIAKRKVIVLPVDENNTFLISFMLFVLISNLIMHSALF